MGGVLSKVQASHKALLRQMGQARQELTAEVEVMVERALGDVRSSQETNIERAVSGAVLEAVAESSSRQGADTGETAELRRQLQEVTDRLKRVEDRTAEAHLRTGDQLGDSSKRRRENGTGGTPSVAYRAPGDPFPSEMQPLLLAGSATSAELPAGLGSPLERALSNPFTFSIQGNQAFESEGEGLRSHAITMMDTASAGSWDLMDLGQPARAASGNPTTPLIRHGYPTQDLTQPRTPPIHHGYPSQDSAQSSAGNAAREDTFQPPSSHGSQAVHGGGAGSTAMDALPDVPPTPFPDLLSLDHVLDPQPPPGVPVAETQRANGSSQQAAEAPLSGQPLQMVYRGTSVHLHRRRSLVMKQAQRHKMLCEQEENREQFNSAALEALSRAGEHLRKTEQLMSEAEETDEAAERIATVEPKNGDEKSEAYRGAEFRAIKAKNACESAYSKLCLLLDSAARVAGPPDPGLAPLQARRNSGGGSFSIKNLWRMGEGPQEGAGAEPPSPAPTLPASRPRPAGRPSGGPRAPVAPTPPSRPSHNRSQSNTPQFPPHGSLDRRSVGSDAAPGGRSSPGPPAARPSASPNPSGHRRSRSSTDMATFVPAGETQQSSKKQLEESIDDIIYELERRRLAL